MRLHTSIFLLLYSSASIADNSISLESLALAASTSSLTDLKELTTKSRYTEDNKTYIRISNKLYRMGSGKELFSKWIIKDLEKYKGVKIYLPIDHTYIKPNPKFKPFAVKSCKYNMASSGTNYIKFENGNLLINTWSCGSLGCSYEFIFTEDKNAC